MFDGVLSLPTDRARALPSSQCGVVRRLDASTCDQVQQLARAEGCDAESVFLAAWLCLLSRWTGQTEIVVDVSDDPGFRDYLRRVTRAFASDRSRADDVEDPRRAPGSRCRTLFATRPSGTVCDLSLVASASRELTFSYATDLFTAETIEGLADQYLVLLAGIVEDPDAHLSRLSLLSERERLQLQTRWREAELGAAPPRCIHELVAARARVAPDAIALVCGDERLTYGDLDRRADQLAARLAALGAAPDVLVGLCTERSIEMIVAILGILKAGSAYLPLEPGMPSDRLAFMIEDAAPPIIVTQRCLAATIPQTGAAVVLIDDLGDGPSSAPCAVTPANLAYCIYTSGSTGRPKGVLVTHENVTRLLSTTERHFSFDERDVWTLFHSFAFDFSVWELFGCLAYGGRLVIVPSTAVHSPDQFWELLEKHGVTVLNMTPSAFRQLVAVAVERPHLAALRVVIFGGEAMYPASLAAWAALYGWDRPALVNMYGITETTVHVTYRRLHAGDATLPAKSPIGIPLDDLGVTILDAAQAPVPRGIPGEMYVRGRGVSRGYLNLPDLTAQRFIPDVYGGTGRLYRTGDLARLTHSGELEYLGRCDAQVKLRGYRIELGEVEACLTAIDPVAEATAGLVGDADAKQIVAWITPRPGCRLETALIREAAAKVLPHYMIPARLLAVPALPLNRNGKIDRGRLLELVDSARADEIRFERPTSSVELELAALWERVLDIRPVGVSDNFFALGGDSLRAVQVVRAARSRGISVTVTELLTSRCLGDLAAKARVVQELP